jgi:hypothetical protein
LCHPGFPLVAIDASWLVCIALGKNASEGL